MGKSRYSKIKDLKFDSYYIDCPVEIEKGALLLDNDLNNVLLQLRFYNVGISVVSSVYISVDCLDDAWDSIPGVNSVEHAYLDLEVADKTSFGEKTPISLDRRVRNVKVTISKATMRDGHVWRNTNAQEFTSPKQESLNQLGTELVNQFNRETNLLKTLQKDRMQYLPKQIEGIWLCSCGRANQNENEICCRCGIQRAWIFEMTDWNYLSSKLSEYKEKMKIAREEQKILDEEAARDRVEKERMENEKQRLAIEEQTRIKLEAEATKRARRKKRNKVIAIVGPICILVSFIVWKSIILPTNRYNQGIAFYESGENSSAIIVFESLGNFKKSEIWLETIRTDYYNDAISKVNSKNYEDGIKLLEGLNGYSDSKDQLRKAKYEYAVYLFNKKYFYEAREYFNSVDGYELATKYLDATCYKIEGVWRYKTINSIQIQSPDTIEFELMPGGDLRKITQGKPSDNIIYKWDQNTKYEFKFSSSEESKFKIVSYDSRVDGELIIEWYIPNINIIVFEPIPD